MATDSNDKPEGGEPPPATQTLVRCSFCGKSQDSVWKIIAGPHVYICDECVDACNEILEQESDKEFGTSEPAEFPGAISFCALCRLPKDAKELRLIEKKDAALCLECIDAVRSAVDETDVDEVD